jgi:hypothetical protein
MGIGQLIQYPYLIVRDSLIIYHSYRVKNSGAVSFSTEFSQKSDLKAIHLSHA